MFHVSRLDVSPVVREPVRLPLRVALLVPRRIAGADDFIFNVPGAVNVLMGGGWDAATRVMQPKVWAPEWDDEHLAEFVSRPFPEDPRPFPPDAIPELRIREFPPTAEPIEILHLVGDPWWHRLELSYLTKRLATRLLILHEIDFPFSFRHLSVDDLVRAGGPATVIVHGGTPAGVSRYFLDLYAGIIHSEPLSYAARPRDDGPYAPDVELILGEGADEALRFGYDTVAESIAFEMQELATAAPRVLNANFADPRRKTFIEEYKPLLEGDVYDLLVDVGPRWSTVPSIVKGNDVFPEKALPPSDDGHVIDVVFFSDDFEPVEEQRAVHALPPESRPDGAGDFPVVEIAPLSEEAPPAYDGDYRRPVARAKIWVPAKSGRSRPILPGGQRRRKAGPVALRVRAPRMTGTARGRLSLYYENNLLQSAAVAVSISHADRFLNEVEYNSIDVDYVLSGSFGDIAEFAARALDDASAPYPVGVSITMNDNGGGSHRLMFAGRDDLTAMRPYDPDAAKKVLDTARGKLKECFFLRDAGCIVQEPEEKRRHALGADNGKSLQQFKCDLWQLAWYGADIYNDAFGQISNPNLIQYLRGLAAALASRTVIQISRTMHAQYVYPWSMIYDIPLPDRAQPNGLRWCAVIEEEWGKGPDARRNGPAAKQCPHHDQPEHRKNTICPYGFWGLKHYIEQPINVLWQPKPGETAPPPPSAVKTVKLGKPITFGVGITRDAQLDPKTMQAHLQTIRQLAALTPAGGADDWNDVQLMLSKPDVAYFLCHGEYDNQLGKPYLSIGPRDGGPQHRVYADQLFQWAVTQDDFWATRHPLVFINGCHTANLVPGEVLSFVPTFANFGASAVIGTEIDIRLPLAVEAGEKLLARILKGEKVGVVMHDLRWELANKGNLLGLAYTPYGLADLTFS